MQKKKYITPLVLFEAESDAPLLGDSGTFGKGDDVEKGEDNIGNNAKSSPFSTNDEDFRYVLPE